MAVPAPRVGEHEYLVTCPPINRSENVQHMFLQRHLKAIDNSPQGLGGGGECIYGRRKEEWPLCCLRAANALCLDHNLCNLILTYK